MLLVIFLTAGILIIAYFIYLLIMVRFHPKTALFKKITLPICSYTREQLFEGEMPEEYVKLKDMNEAYKESVYNKIHESCSQIILSENPVIKTRELIVNYTIALANVLVLLSFDKKTKKSAIFKNSLFSNPSLSFELHNHLREIIEKDDSIKNLYVFCLEETKNSPVQLSEEEDFEFFKNFLVIDADSNKFILNKLNIARVILKDVHESKELDWLNPLLSSMMIYAESHYRDLLGIEDIAEKKMKVFWLG